MTQRSIRLVSIVLAALLACVIAGFALFSNHPTPKRMTYKTTKSEKFSQVRLNVTDPTTEWSQVQETPIEQKLRVGEGIELIGELTDAMKRDRKPVIVRFVIITDKRRETIAQSAAELVPPGALEFSLKLDLPAKPGAYDLRVMWGAPDKLVARAHVVVEKKQ